MHWKLKLDCVDCGATVTFEDEKPEWLGAGDERYVTCPACGGRAEASPRPRLDLQLNKAFGAFRGRASR
jgi:DNA-directed RNA polymerase subunit RPC12/RpoP